MTKKEKMIKQELESIEEHLEKASELRASMLMNAPIGTILVQHPLAQEVLINLITEELDKVESEISKRKSFLESVVRIDKIGSRINEED